MKWHALGFCLISGLARALAAAPDSETRHTGRVLKIEATPQGGGRFRLARLPVRVRIEAQAPGAFYEAITRAFVQQREISVRLRRVSAGDRAPEWVLTGIEGSAP